MSTDDSRAGPGTVPATPAFTREMETLLVRAAADTARPALRRARLPWRTGPRLALAVAATVVVSMIALLGPLPGGGPRPAAAVGMVFPDGQVVDVLGAVLGDGDVHTLRQRLSELGVELVVRELPSDPSEAGRVLRIELPPGAEVDDERRVVVSSAQGGAVVLDVGRAGSAASGAHPELCAAIDPYDPVGTGRRLADLGYRVRWDLVTPSGGGDREKARTEQRSELPGPREGTFIISVLIGETAGSSLGAGKDLVIETTPAGGAWHAPTRLCR